MNKSEAINELAMALAKAQAKFPTAKKDKNNPYYASKYADIASLIDVIQDDLAANGLSIVQLPTSYIEPKEVSVETILLHSSGQWISSSIAVPAIGVAGKDKNDGREPRIKYDAQTIGSAITYARRYGLQSILNLAAADDDGNLLSMEHERKTKAEETVENVITGVVDRVGPGNSCVWLRVKGHGAGIMLPDDVTPPAVPDLGKEIVVKVTEHKNARNQKYYRIVQFVSVRTLDAVNAEGEVV